MNVMLMQALEPSESMSHQRIVCCDSPLEGAPVARACEVYPNATILTVRWFPNPATHAFRYWGPTVDTWMHPQQMPPPVDGSTEIGQSRACRFKRSPKAASKGHGCSQ